MITFLLNIRWFGPSFFISVVLMQDKVGVQSTPKTLGFDCCSDIRVSSNSFARERQPSSMGNYYALPGKLNNRLVYRHITGRQNIHKMATMKSEWINTIILS